MATTGRVLKRVLVGRALRSDRLGETLLPKRLGLPVFASDNLSSVAYAPDEIMLTLAVAGGAFAYLHSWQVGLAVVVIMLVVVSSYRQTVRAYPTGGGDYEVASVNLGPRAGLGVGSALMVDYVLTVAVSISAGVQNAAAALSFIRGYEVAVAVGLIVLLTGLNLRGARESGRFLAVPVYAFMAAIGLLALSGLVQMVTGTLPQADSARYELVPDPGYQSMTALAVAFLLLRAFASGSVALTGVQGVSNGVPAFRRPRSRNAATVLLLMALISGTMLMSLLLLAREAGVQFALDPQVQLRLNGQPVGEDYVQDTVIGQLSKTVFDDLAVAVLLVSVITGVMLVVAANTAFNGFPVLASRLAKDGFLPRQLHTRGDRLAFSNGILTLAAAAAALVAVYNAEVTRLIQLYIVGVFVSFTLSQIGMIRHWNRNLRLELSVAERRRMIRSRLVNTVGALLSATVLLVVLVTRFTHGAGYALVAIAAIYVVLIGIHRHYQRVREEVTLPDDPVAGYSVPSRVHAVVLVSKLHKPTTRALAYARATRPNVLEAVTVDVDAEETRALQQEWERRDVPVTLRALESPYREVTRPVIDYVKRVRRDSPRDIVVVYLPEYVVGRWYERLLHNRSALRLKAGLAFTPGVMIATVPWQMESSEGHEPQLETPLPGAFRGPGPRGPA